ncbi:MAG: site-specific integrase [Desulfobacterales bacterium]|nr:site-specific integrase [Desulfobacterales bacterium]
MGSLFLRGKTWWIKYYQNGKCFRQSSGSTKKMVARKLLDRKEGEIAQGKLPGTSFDKVIFDELAVNLIRDYKINQRKSLRRIKNGINHLKTAFEGMSIPRITTPEINKYVENRIDMGAANATINRELSALKRMLNLGAQQTPPLVDRVPHIPMLKENNTRKGFFEHEEYLALQDALPKYLKGFVAFAYKCGWRVSEIKNLKWSNVDLHQGIVRLESGETKNTEGRTVYLDEALKDVFQNQWAGQKKKKKISPYVFPGRTGVGKIRDFRVSWNTACRAAGIPNRIFHDFRRTAVRNMVRSGIPERVAMMISGHKTRAVFERYNIVNDADLIEAARKQEAYLENLPRAQFGHNRVNL